LPDNDFTVAEVNHSFLKKIGKCQGDVIGKSVFSNLPAGTNASENIRCSLQKVTDTGLPYRLTIANEEISETVPVLSDSGEIEYIIHSIRDDRSANTFCIDKKCLNEKKQLSASEEKYKKLFQLSPMPKLVYDLETFEIFDVNEIAEEQYGYSREEFLTMKLQDLRSADQIPKLYQAHRNLKNEDARLDFGLFIHLKKDKTPMHVEVSGNRFRFKGRECMMVVCLDVTKRENALSQLEDNQQKLLAAQTIAKIGYWKRDLKTGRVFWSDEIFKILGFNKGEHKASHESFFGKLHPEDKDTFSRQRQLALEDKKVLDIEFRIVNDDGTIKWVHEKGKLVKNEADEPVSYEGTIQDITESKLLKLSLEESNQRYEYVTKATFDAIWDWDLVTDKSYWGEGFERTFGYEIDKINTNREFWSSHIHPDDFNEVVKGIQRSIMSDATNWSNEFRFQKADGSYAFVMDKCIIIRDKNGKAVRLVGAMQDISEKKTLQQLLDKANRLARIGSWEIDVPSATVYWSEITKEIRETGPDYQPSLQDGIGHFKEGYSRNTIIARVKESVHFGTPWQEDLQIYTHKGNLKWIRTTGKAELKDGKCVKIYGSFQDIDESKKAELEILKLYEEKNSILESIGDGFFTVDKNWIVTYWNDAAEKMLGMPKEKLLGKNLWGVFSQNMNPHSYRKYHEAIETSKRIFFEDYYPVLDRWFEVSAYPSKNGLSVYFKDITDRITAQMELNQLNLSLQKTAQDLAISNAELEQFAYIASHDLQEPLRMITSFLAQIEKKYHDILDEKGKQYIRFAVDGAKRMRQIILDLLEFSRVGRFEGKVQEINVNELVGEVVSVYEKKIEDSAATIHFLNLPTVICFKTPLRQVFQNLIGNALKYQPPGAKPVINIQAEETPEYWKFLVKDNGIGIEPDYYDRIFNIFQRLHNKEEYSGTGIGLAIVKKIVEAMGGKIWIEPNEEKGSIFIFTISKQPPEFC
jgi:PAS domain S-box-containing protein